MGWLEIIGACTVGATCLFVAYIAYSIAGNIYGGIKGVYRLRAAEAKTYGEPRITHRFAVRFGFRRWLGFGDEFWTWGGLELPLDGRKPVRKARR